jgi:4-amino-4-deoxy-L-arabinose transferase-like glycosyltransferase
MDRQEKRLYIFGLTAVLILAALTRFLDLGSKSFWIDEGTTAFEISGELESFLHPPGYFLLARPFYKLFGDSEYSLRLVPALSGWLTVLFIFLLTRQVLFQKRHRTAAALTAALIAAVNPYWVAVSQECRMYGVIGLIAAASTYFLYRANSEELGYGQPAKRPWLWWAAYAVVIIYGTYTHVFTFALLAAGNLFLLWLAMGRKVRIKYWRYVLVQVGIAVAYLPLAATTAQMVALRRETMQVNFSHISPYYYVYNMIRNFFRYSVGYTFGAPGEGLAATYAENPSKAVFLVFGCALVIAGSLPVLAGLYRLYRDRLRSFPLIFLTVFVPFLLFVALTLDNALPRQLSLAAPFFYIGLSAGLFSLPKAWLKICAGLILAGNILLYIPYARCRTIPYTNAYWRGLSAYLSENVPPQDLVLVFFGQRDGYYTLKYYRCTAHLRFARKPHMSEDMPLKVAVEADGRQRVRSESEIVNELFLQDHPQRIWCLTYHFAPNDLIRVLHGRKLEHPYGREMDLIVCDNPHRETGDSSGSTGLEKGN